MMGMTSFSTNSRAAWRTSFSRSEEHTSELQLRLHLVCRLLLGKKKLKEILLASLLKHNLSTDDILFLYLNHINFGKAHYGVEEPSLYYFNKHVQDVDLGEADML